MRRRKSDIRQTFLCMYDVNVAIADALVVVVVIIVPRQVVKSTSLLTPQHPNAWNFYTLLRNLCIVNKYTYLYFLFYLAALCVDEHIHDHRDQHQRE